jgi:hypothetical protein
MGKKAKAKAKRGVHRVRRKAAIMTYPEPAAASGWRWIVDDRMRDYGETDYERRVIRINRIMHRKYGESLIDTLFHEELHRKFPLLGERTICAMTRVLLPTLSKRYKAWLYARIRDRYALEQPHQGPRRTPARR